MEYTFEIIGVSPILAFFNHQESRRQQGTVDGQTNDGQTNDGQTNGRAEYLGAYRCTLDALLESVEAVPPDRGWNLDRVVDSVVRFWLNHPQEIDHWKQRLFAAGSENLVVARVSDLNGLRAEFEALWNPDRP